MKIQRLAKSSKAQSVLEYALLASLAIMAFLAMSSFLTSLKGNAFKSHFTTVKSRITGSY